MKRSMMTILVGAFLVAPAFAQSSTPKADDWHIKKTTPAAKATPAAPPAKPGKPAAPPPPPPQAKKPAKTPDWEPPANWNDIHKGTPTPSK